MPSLLTDRIGLEIEVEDIPQRRIKTSSIFNVTHDASCERNTTRYQKRLGEYSIKYDPSITVGSRGDVTTMGGELVSVNPLYYSSNGVGFESELDAQLELLINAGERPFSYRGSTHVHINFPVFETDKDTAIRILRDTVRVGRHLEELFFHIGGMGYKYRGVVINNSAYCRPITGRGPQVVLAETASGSRPVQVLNVDDILSTNTAKDYFTRIGNSPVSPGNVDRYHPARYTWLNLYGILLHRTLEFRVFNKVLSRHLITTAIKLCQEVTTAILDGTFTKIDLEENSIYNSTGSRKSHDVLETFVSKLERKPFYLGDKEMKLLHNMLDSSELTGSDFGEFYVYTHLRRFNRTSGRNVYSTAGGYCPEIITTGDILDSDFVDIHNMYGSSPRRRE